MSAIARFFSGLKRGARNFGETMVIIVNSALLLVVYLIGIGLTSILSKLAGRKFLDTKPSKEKRSYWSDLNLGKKPQEDYYRQF